MNTTVLLDPNGEVATGLACTCLFFLPAQAAFTAENDLKYVVFIMKYKKCQSKLEIYY